jgi:hypothetical protein
MTRSWMSEVAVPHSPLVPSQPSAFSTRSRQSTQPNSPYPSTYSPSAPQSDVHITPPVTQILLPPEQRSEPRGRTLARPQFSSVLDTISGSPATDSAYLLQGDRASNSIAHYIHVAPTRSSSRPGGTRKSSSIVFLSVGLLFGFSRLSWYDLRQHEGVNDVWSLRSGNRILSGKLIETRGGGSHNFDWPQLQYPVVFRPSSLLVAPLPSTPNIALSRRQIFPLSLSISTKSSTESGAAPSVPLNQGDGAEFGGEYEGDEEEDGPDYRRILGRASAWLCTTLYLTSRMPQLWKNVSHMLPSSCSFSFHEY